MNAIKAAGGAADTRHIKKHRNDVFRMVATVPPAAGTFDIPSAIYEEIQKFCEMSHRVLDIRAFSPQYQYQDRKYRMCE